MNAQGAQWDCRYILACITMASTLLVLDGNSIKNMRGVYAASILNKLFPLHRLYKAMLD